MASMLRTAAVVTSLATLAGCVSVQATSNKQAGAPQGQVKAVYHLTNGLDEAQRGMGNVRNHLAADPKAKIVVVGNGAGIEFMLDGAKDKNGSAFDATIADLKSQGVEFRLCRNTLVTRKIDPSKVNPDVSIVPSGVAEAARLQQQDGYAYLRP
ncbi:MAG: DsrE family protein [Polyangiaceae bacterium]|nr:DsrE family protein [Polyangiaceae bacterium]